MKEGARCTEGGCFYWHGIGDDAQLDKSRLKRNKT